MKLSVRNRRSGSVQFTAEIDCAEDEVSRVKIALAVMWGIKNGADLSGADLRDADLSDADLSCANLRGANLNFVNLRGADLSDANLNLTSLRYANLNLANLRGADLNFADLNFANLNGANLRDTNLIYANLNGSNLNGANLHGANLRGADLKSLSGLNIYTKSIQLETYAITYTSDVMQIGCERHLISEWAEFDDKRILQMDGKDALKFWRKYKSWIFQTIELAPAEPTKVDKVA